MKIGIRTISIRSRLILMLLSVSTLAAAVVIYIGYTNSREAIEEGTFNQLKGIRASKQNRIESYFKDTKNVVEILADNEELIDAMKAFKRGFRKLSDSDIPVDCSRQLANYYDDFLDNLAQNMQVKSSSDLYYPNTQVGCYLQYEYIIDNKNKIGEKYLLNNAGDGSKYSDAHQKYNKYLSDIILKFNFYDIFLIDLEKGDIVYTAYKEVDFATNLYTGPYRESNLGVLVRQLRENRDFSEAQIIDFKPYRPSYGAPASFIGRTITDGSETIGALVIQLPIDEVNKIMTGDESWKEDGLGDSGETYLVGEDYLLRSVSRFYLEDTLGYTEALLGLGMEQEKIDLMYRLGTPILTQRVKTAGVELALAGKTDTKIIKDYRGVPVLSSFSPLRVPGLKWSILSEIDVAEVDIPINKLRKKVLIALCIITLLVTFLAMFLSSRFVVPIEKLTRGVRRLKEGDFDSRIDVEGNDEFSELSHRFNDMVSDLDTQQKLIEQHSRENEELMLNFIPKTVAARLKMGEKNIADTHTNVSLIVIDIVGFSELITNIGAKEAVALLNNITDAFDEAGRKNHVEKIRTVGDTYFAACGLFAPRLDHAKRAIDFAKEAKLITGQFNINHQLSLSLEFGIHTGEVTAGIVGSSKFSYDLFGETVNETFAVKNLEINNSILITDAIYHRVKDFYDFEELESVKKSPYDAPIWMYKNDKKGV